MAQNQEVDKAVQQTDRILTRAVRELERLVKNAAENPEFNGTIRVEVGIKHGVAQFGRLCPDQTFK